jgi:small subunit ribosomal protein S6
VRTYEMMAVLAPDIPEEEMPAALERISGFITTNNGEVTELITTSPWGRRRLAYEIRDYRDGFYALYHFNLDPSRVGEVERELRLNNQVLRSLVVTYTPPKPKKPKKGAEGDQAEAAQTGEAASDAQIAAPSGATMDTPPPQDATGPDGEDLNAPPTAETPAADEGSESEPAR